MNDPFGAFGGIFGNLCGAFGAQFQQPLYEIHYFDCSICCKPKQLFQSKSVVDGKELIVCQDCAAALPAGTVLTWDKVYSLRCARAKVVTGTVERLPTKPSR